MIKLYLNTIRGNYRVETGNGSDYICVNSAESLSILSIIPYYTSEHNPSAKDLRHYELICTYDNLGDMKKNLKEDHPELFV